MGQSIFLPSDVTVLSVARKEPIKWKRKGKERSAWGRLAQAAAKDRQKAQEDEIEMKVTWSNMSEDERLEIFGFSKTLGRFVTTTEKKM